MMMMIIIYLCYIMFFGKNVILFLKQFTFFILLDEYIQIIYKKTRNFPPLTQ